MANDFFAPAKLATLDERTVQRMRSAFKLRPAPLFVVHSEYEEKLGEIMTIIVTQGEMFVTVPYGSVSSNAKMEALMPPPVKRTIDALVDVLHAATKIGKRKLFVQIIGTLVHHFDTTGEANMHDGVSHAAMGIGRTNRVDPSIN